MKSLVKLSNKHTGKDKVLTFEHASALVAIDKGKDFKCIDDNYEIINNELIKRPSNEVGERTTKPKRSNKGKKVPK